MIKQGKNKDLNYQMNLFKEIILKNNVLKTILERLEGYGLDNYYVAAGAINQTVFNYYHNNSMDYLIDDYDIVYYDEDLSYEKEDKIIKEINLLCKDLNVSLDIKNQARVHLWFKNKFGYSIEPNKSVEDAISKWGSTVTCIGVRLKNNELTIFAPYGLNDLFSLIIRPNKENFIKKGYEEKTRKLKQNWPKLTIIPWDND